MKYKAPKKVEPKGPECVWFPYDGTNQENAPLENSKFEDLMTKEKALHEENLRRISLKDLKGRYYRAPDERDLFGTSRREKEKIRQEYRRHEMRVLRLELRASRRDGQ